mmetsp:Transcript_18684/g.28608  ORF Transcript_18684/g.28608 Transcript_18684/m.28608 type:complete len:164 (+) Transcript_18684:83-574(+)
MAPSPSTNLTKQKWGFKKKGIATEQLDSEEMRKLIEEKAKAENLNKFITKGHRNRNNPAIDISRAGEVIIVKKANYSDCLSCHLCVRNNKYKVYSNRDFRDWAGAPEFMREDTLEDEVDEDQDSLEMPEGTIDPDTASREGSNYDTRKPTAGRALSPPIMIVD